jgi:predicted ATPase/class 3 adenylate cyclase
LAELPTGTVTFLFTDLEGSTRLWEQHPEAMKEALARHDAILREAVGAHGGHLVKTTGDGVHAAFATAHDAVDAALDAQRALTEEPWGAAVLRVRMGVHTGEAEFREGDYFGGVLNRAARLMSVAHGGQTLVSHVTAELVEDSLSARMGLRDLGEHRLRDLSRPERVFQLVGPGCEGEFPPLRSVDVFLGNLPVQVTSFVGRGEELTSVGEELARARLVTLTGVGGVGKTRLALEVASAVVAGYRDGAWLVELAGVRDPEAVADAIVATFGLQPLGGLSSTETVLEFLAGKSLLLVLDNCEHLLRSVGNLVAQLLRGCPGVRVLATSREGLNVAGERMLGVASLDVPDPGVALEAVAQCDAVLLFVERARAVKAGFVLEATNADAVAQVCRRLDGVALAIELAAARVAMLTPAELARRLDQRFRLLTGGQRGAIERHQTLRAAIDWSYDLLSGTEQVLLARLSVFAGGFTLEAAEAVTPGGVLAADEVFEVLAALVARSLVVAETEDMDSRYRLLETIRQYAQEHLDDSGNGDRLRRAHAAYYADFGEYTIPKIAGRDGIEWERRVDRESDNIRAALTWSIETRDTDTAVRLLAMWNAAPVLISDASLASVVHWAADLVLTLPGASEHPTYPTALVVAAADAWIQADVARAERRCEEALAAQARLGTEPSLLLGVAQVSVALLRGDARAAVQHSEPMIDMARARGETAWLAHGLAGSAVARTMLGDIAGAVADAEEVFVLAPGLANTRAVQSALALAAFALGESEPERALELARHLVEVVVPGERSVTWAIAGDLAARNGERREALAYTAKAIDDFYWLGQRMGLGTVIGRAGLLLLEVEPEAAAVLGGAGDAIAPGFAHAPHVMQERRDAIAALDTALGPTRHAELHAQGMTMNDADAVAYAHAAISRNLGDDIR